MKSVCTKIFTELNNKNRILEHLIRHLGEMIDNNKEKLDDELQEDFDSLYEALNSLKQQYKDLEENLFNEIDKFNNRGGEIE
jgi:translation initiation factor 2 alpha subunit (eIF-2alpha)